MKKQYIQPSMKEYKIETMGMLALSRGQGYDPNDVSYAPGMSWDDDDFEEE